MMSTRIGRALFLLAGVWIISGACVEFYNIAWGTGVWLGQLALKWALALFLFGLFCILCLVGTWIVLWSLKKLERPFESLSSFRDRLGTFRWVLAALFLAAPVYFLQYTFWGIVLHDHYLRILLAGFSGILLGWLLTKEANQLINWQGILTSFILVSGSFVLFVSLKEVTAYPFSLGWSEGNRLWDYSILFGRHLYDYPLDKPIPVLLDFGRKFVGGVPFLIPSVNIWQVRLWLALVDIVPYLVLGWAAFRLAKNNIMKWTLAGIWAFTFVHQGPIHPPLLLSAIVVALAWERPLWLAVPLIAVASYFAVISRLTWLFAPGMWAVMLELSGAVTAQNDPPGKRIWFRSAAAGLAGVLGGYAAPFWVPSLLRWIRTISESPVAVNPDVIVGRNVTMAAVNATVTTQPLLWSRLLPNATYNEGILIGLLLAVLPLIAVLIYLVRTGRWKLTTWQKLAIILPLLSFLVVGLIASVKIGGGADLHNLDMLIIGLMFVGAIAWRNGGSKWIDEIQAAPVWVKFVLVALILIPGYQPLMHMSPLVITEDRTTVAALADIHEDPLPNPLPDTLPSQPDTIKTLESIRKEVAKAAQNGDVLFMDQRQLLTFGYIKDVPLIPEYDKKVLINEALSGDARYFASFYRDLASRRFSLIVTNPVNRRLDKTEGHFSEENNAWVKWVSTPLLCYYESLDRLKRVDVELLVPRQDISTCEQGLPIQINK